MVGALKEALEHDGAQPHVGRAERQRARQLGQANRGRAAAQHQQPARPGGSRGLAGELAHHAQGAGAGGARGRKLGRIADHQIVAAVLARAVERLHRVFTLELHLAFEAIQDGRVGRHRERQGALVDG